MRSSVVRKKKSDGNLMPKVKRNNVRENRIINEIIVDAYDAEEQVMIGVCQWNL
jgi:hypothetical protein